MITSHKPAEKFQSRRKIIELYDDAYKSLNTFWSRVIRIKDAGEGSVEWYTNLSIAMKRFEEPKFIRDDCLLSNCDRLIITAHMLIVSGNIVWEFMYSYGDEIDILLDKVEALSMEVDKRKC